MSINNLDQSLQMITGVDLQVHFIDIANTNCKRWIQLKVSKNIDFGKYSLQKHVWNRLVQMKTVQRRLSTQ